MGPVLIRVQDCPSQHLPLEVCALAREPRARLLLQTVYQKLRAVDGRCPAFANGALPLIALVYLERTRCPMDTDDSMKLLRSAKQAPSWSRKGVISQSLCARSGVTKVFLDAACLELMAQLFPRHVHVDLSYRRHQETLLKRYHLPNIPRVPLSCQIVKAVL